MRVYKLDYAVLSIRNNPTNFLNGLTSNSLDQHQNAFVNQHGRIIATCFIQKASEDEFLIAVPVVALELLLNHLERYAKLNRVTIQKTDLKTYMDLDQKQVLFSKENLKQVSQEEFTLFRLDNHLPLMGINFQADEFLLNVDEHAYVSYTKGCFLGQEPIAKVHNRSKPSRKLVVQFEDECSKADTTRMTSKAKDPATGRYKGFIFISQ